MMKWKVVKNPRSSSADRSLECLKNDLQQNNHSSSDSNNNVGEEGQQENGPTPKETNRQRESSLVRKPSIVATECINLKSILGLTRQRSETNLSSLGLIGSETRRSRSEVRGVSCDRLTVGYHTTPGKPTENGKTRSSSPPCRSGWLRGRKRERESRNPLKNNQEAFGKTVVTGSNRKRTDSKSRNGDCRTIVDGSDASKQKSKPCSSGKSSLEPRKSKGNRKSGEDDIIKEEIYSEIGKLPEDSTDAFKDPNKVIRKKGMAPKPQVTPNGDANPKPSGSPTSLNEVPRGLPNRKPPRKTQTYNGRNPEKNRAKQNNLKNSESALLKTKNNINAQSVVAVAEIHRELLSLNLDTQSTNTVPDHEPPDKLLPEPLRDLKEAEESGKDEALPFHIDTPDYSTLDSVNCNSFSLSTEEMTFSKEDVVNCNTDCDESLQDSRPLSSSKAAREVSLSSILRDSTCENKTDSEPKKTVRFEKLDLIEKYKKHKTDAEDEANETKPKNPLDVNSNEIEPQSLITVNVVVRNPSPVPPDSPSPFVAKKSFVLTVAKQEKGFRSLCANKKLESAIPEPPPTPTQAEQQISVTFLCSGPPSEGWVADDRHRLRSTSVPPPMSLQPVEMLPSIRGRSRDRKSKERQHCKKNHKARKKDAVFVMPQAVIDELSQVLEKRKPSLDEIPVHP